MSRARYVWVVTSTDGTLLTAFTVKWECSEWLGRRHLGLVKVQRVDTAYYLSPKVTDLNPETLEPAV